MKLQLLGTFKGIVYFYFPGKDYVATHSLLLVKRGIFFFPLIYFFFRTHSLPFLGSGIFFFPGLLSIFC